MHFTYLSPRFFFYPLLISFRKTLSSSSYFDIPYIINTSYIQKESTLFGFLFGSISVYIAGEAYMFWRCGRSIATFMFWVFFFVYSDQRFTEGYDALDPFGNVSINWDFQTLSDDGIYSILVTIYNYQLYRHIDSPGWKLGWTWPGLEVIWDMRGAEATEQGNCSRFRGDNLPHCCSKTPVIVDLLPGAPYNMQSSNCCRGGVISSTTQHPSKSLASFQMSVGGIVNYTNGNIAKPSNFNFGVPGYTCSDVKDVEPTKYFIGGSRRMRQSLMTWQVICTYSQIIETTDQGCCVSLSAFYNDTVIPCSHCACACQDQQTGPSCLQDDQSINAFDLNGVASPTVRCTDHMCPIRVHWHVKLNYRDYWRVKVTVTNFALAKNFSDWSLVVQHPNLQNLTQVFSFNYQPAAVYKNINDTGIFWGIDYYNDMLLSYGESGNVQTEMLLQKIPGEFAFNGGWAFPQTIMFNGIRCVMPPPDMYPTLPNFGSSQPTLVHSFRFTLMNLLVFSMLMFL